MLTNRDFAVIAASFLLVSAAPAPSAPYSRGNQNSRNSYSYGGSGRGTSGFNPGGNSGGHPTPAHPTPSPEVTPSFGVTCWGADPTTGQPGCRVYTTTPSGFQQYSSDDTSISGWTKDSTIIQYGSGITPASETPMTVLNTYDNGGSEITIFFVTKSNKIVCQSHTNDDFALCNPNLPVVGTPTFLTSVTWKNTDGSNAYAVLYRDNSGSVHQWRKDYSGKWNNDGTIPGLKTSGTFVVTVNVESNGYRMGNLYTSDGQHFQTTGTNDITGLGWKRVGSYANNAGITGMSGGLLPWDNSQNRFYGVGSQKELQEYSLNGADWVPNDLTFGVSPVGQIPTATVIYKTSSADFINVFSLVSEGGKYDIQSVVWTTSKGGIWTSPIDVSGSF